MKRSTFLSRYLSIFCLIVFVCVCCSVEARPIRKGQAENAGKGWLRRNQRPMGRQISRNIQTTASYTDETGQVLYYVIDLEPEGFVVLSADDEIEPVIAFSSKGYFVDDESNPLKAMLERDMRGRLLTVHERAADAGQVHAGRGNPVKWNSLLKAGGDLEADGLDDLEADGISGISDVYVEPFLQAEWDQGDVLGSPCYNYYTPNNYPTGCVATAMAQLMRYYTWPTTGIGVNSFTIKVNGVSTSASTLGGNGSGGAYSWTSMPTVPLSGVTTTQRQAIGALCYDAGVSVGMAYTSSGSSASLHSADQRLTGTFLYSNSVYTQTFSSSGDYRLWNLLNTNLDAGMPVLVGIDNHAVVSDGYGYNSGVLYHHMNMGWGGRDNAWYQLPIIQGSSTGYTSYVIDDCVYNVYTSGSGEIISGCVTNLAGAPLSGATVRAYYGSTLSKQTTTNSKGIYALKNLTSNRTYRITVTKTGENFLDQNVAVGQSADWGTPGNRWGINFVSATIGPPTVFEIEADADSPASINVQLKVLDDGNPDPNLLHCIITSLPSHGVLSEPNVGPIDAVPYVLGSDANSVSVTYTPCPYFGGQDSFTYMANDGGTYPTGGDSNIATVTVNVNNEQVTDYHSDSNLYTWGILDTSNYAVRSQMIYLSGEIGSSKRITGLAINVYSVPGRALSNWTIRMRHTTMSAYTSLTQIYPDWTVVYQAGETLTSGWNWFYFDTPFDYNGTSNLMIDLSFWNGGIATDGTYFAYNSGQARNYMMFDADGDAGSPLNWVYSSAWDYYNQSAYMPAMQFLSESSADPIPGDFDASCDVRLPDVAIFSQAWGSQTGDAAYNADCDLTTVKGAVDIQDMAILAEHWLEVYSY